MLEAAKDEKITAFWKFGKLKHKTVKIQLLREHNKFPVKKLSSPIRPACLISSIEMPCQFDDIPCLRVGTPHWH